MNLFLTLCSSVFLIFAFITSGSADEHFPFLAEVSKESVNVRSGPNTNFEKVDKLNQGAQVVVLGHMYEWYKVQPPPTTKSYIRSDYLQMKSVGVAVVSGNNVNVRASANTNAASLGEVKEGTMVKVLGTSGGWSELAPVAGTAVWIHQDFLRKVADTVPASLWLKAPQPGGGQTQALAAPSATNPWVSLRGTVEALVSSARKDIHYEIVLGDKSVFYLQDIPNLPFFCNAMVDVEGAIVPDPAKKLMYPLLHLNKIQLVL